MEQNEVGPEVGPEVEPPKLEERVASVEEIIQRLKRIGEIHPIHESEITAITQWINNRWK